MSLARFAKRRDKSEKTLFATAKMMGGRIWPLDTPCDAIMLYAGRWHAIECKEPKASFTPSQLEFRRCVQEAGGRILIWRREEDVIRDMDGLKDELWSKVGWGDIR